MFKYLFKKDTLLATLMVFAVMGLLSLIPLNTHVLDPIKLALQDFDYNDMAWSQFGKNKNSSVDTNIVVVHIGNANRAELAKMIDVIDSEQPAVIATDVLFNEARDTQTDSILLHALQKPSVVSAYRLVPAETDSPAKSFFPIDQHQSGYANFVAEDGGVIRNFAPHVEINDRIYYSFATSIVKKIAPEKYAVLEKRNHITEEINYSRTIQKYLIIDGMTLLDSSSSFQGFKNKIVIMGFTPSDEHNMEDKHFTPMNTKSVGKTRADMQGAIIHANIIDMLMNENYINRTPSWLVWLVAVLLCWLHMAVFVKYFLDHHLWFHLVAKIAQLISTVLFVYLGLLFFVQADIKLNLAPTLLAIILAVDVLYFYEAIAKWLNLKFNFKTIFAHASH